MYLYIPATCIPYYHMSTYETIIHVYDCIYCNKVNGSYKNVELWNNQSVLSSCVVAIYYGSDCSKNFPSIKSNVIL